jgi:hypothetical protein
MSNKTMEELENMTLDEYLEYLDESEITHSTISVSVSDWNKRFSNRKIVANHDYQRAEGAWKLRLQKGLLYSLLKRRPIPPIITVHNPETMQKEIVDGQHRLITTRDFHKGKIPLPRFIPSKFGGGKTIQDVPPEIIARIDGTFITEMILHSQSGELNTNDIKDIYGALQKSALLTLGQEIRSKHGSYRDLIDDLSENPLCSKFGQKADKELQFAAYAVTYWYQTVNNRIPWFKKSNVIELLEDIEGEPCNPDVRADCFKVLDCLDEVVQEVKLNNFYAVSVMITIGELMKQEIPLEQIKQELHQCFLEFWGLCQKIRFDDKSLNYNNQFIRGLNDIIKNNPSVDNSKRLYEMSDFLLEVWNNEGALPV